MIDDIYKVVQIIANKNNYGIITPDRFNKLCKDAQLKILSELPNDLRRANNRVKSPRASDKGTTLVVDQIRYIINIFIEKTVVRKEVSTSFPSGFTDYFILPDNILYINSLWFKKNVEIEEVDKMMSGYVRGSLMVSPTEQYPSYENIGHKIYIQPTSIGLDSTSGTITDDVELMYQRLPLDPKWTFLVINGIPIFNISDNSYQDFELPESVFDRLVMELAGLIGIHLREQEIIQFVQRDQMNKLQRDTLS